MMAWGAQGALRLGQLRRRVLVGEFGGLGDGRAQAVEPSAAKGS